MPTSPHNPHRVRRAVCIALLCAAAFAPWLNGSLAHGGWPFSSSSTSPEPRLTLTAQGSWWNPFARKPGQKSMLRKASDSTWGTLKSAGNSMKKGASYLNPWRKREDNTPITGVTQHRSRNKEKEQSNGWLGWMRPKPNEPPRTVTEWMNQKRPEVR